MSWDNYNGQDYYGSHDPNEQYAGYEDPQQQGYDPNYYGAPGAGYYNPNDYYATQQQQQQQHTSNAPLGPGQVGEFLQSNPMISGMAMAYGQEFVGKGSAEIQKNWDKYINLEVLRYYFAVDTAYVASKLRIILFPFTKSNWAKSFSEEGGPVMPKCDVNATDLYIPLMSYVTYILVSGYISGLMNAFTPDGLATTAYSALLWLLLEMGIFYFSSFIFNIPSDLSKWDVLAYSSYKYVGVVLLCLIGLIGSRLIYYLSLIYTSIAVMVFLARSLKRRINPERGGVGGSNTAGKMYILLFITGVQPFFLWWFTFSYVMV
ncbi:protein YIF1B [Lepeophtheirus salmonis]|uniref:Protein YIF1 n=1 Tax=Lepeophtheirus salmonis TaxID=72036 RepID=C1BTG2_LEPSM|nr:protein YIF1B-like [Lepeophtheirus salmonis]ACO12315.1 YIF1B [Lepeophtheirus salmonis]